MREGRANGGVAREGGGADAAATAAPAEAARLQKQPQSNPSSSGSAASSSYGGGEAEERGGKSKQERRRSKRREDVMRAIRDRLPAAPACWGNVSVVQERTGRRERPDAHGRNRNGGGGAVEVQEGSGSGAGTAAAPPAWCCICPEGDCSLEANPSANGKEEPGLRSLLERNDFYSDDCNPHSPAGAAANDDDDLATPAADFD